MPSSIQSKNVAIADREDDRIHPFDIWVRFRGLELEEDNGDDVEDYKNVDHDTHMPGQ